MAITALPTPPTRNDPANFADRADEFLAALPTFAAEANAQAAALTLNSTTDTSTSSVSISTGAKTFTVSSGKSYQPGMWLSIADAAAPSTNSMIAQITSYSGTTLIVNVTLVFGSGTKTNWVISQSAPVRPVTSGNKLINGNKLVAQWSASNTVFAGTNYPTASTGYYTTDRFFSYCTGANVSITRVNGSNATNKRDQYTGASGVTAIGHGTRLEASDTAHMAGETCTYTVELANSLLTSVTWAVYYANTSNAFGTIGTPTKTQIATGTFTVNSTVSNYTAVFSVPSAATTGIEIVLTVGAQTSGTWTIGREDFRIGSTSLIYFEAPDYEETLRKCQRYLPAALSVASNEPIGTGQCTGTANSLIFFPFKVRARVAPSGVITSSVSNFYLSSANGSSLTTNALVYGYAGTDSAFLAVGVVSGLVAGNSTLFSAAIPGQAILFTGCEIP